MHALTSTLVHKICLSHSDTIGSLPSCPTRNNPQGRKRSNCMPMLTLLITDQFLHRISYKKKAGGQF